MQLITTVVFAISLLSVPGETRPWVHSSLQENPLSSDIKTDRPIIGILAQNTDGYVQTFGPTYIVASYIKYIESAGGRVVPIRNNLTEDQLEDLFKSINGVLFPGGGADIYDSPYSRTGNIIFNLAKKANDAGDVFPLWGTCLGFQFLSVQGAGGRKITSDVDGQDFSVPLNLSEGYKSSRLLGSAPENIITYLKTDNVTYNHHRECISTKANEQLKKFYNCLSTNRGKKGKEFVSTMEAYDYPFYGTQWHPEKNSFEWTLHEAINHSEEAVAVTQYVADFFVNQARLSGHRFPSKEEEDAALIYHDNPIYCKPELTHFEQCYIF
ncbi:unnamed protein product [Pocillopora meandrina]|uniref:folate gamma-glutamyl hydrolase n=1 Tax=Pocillopora meandrina TaxID=46732 RepID=A0AAU9X5N3_9CNID|nr:unnamed protein product [Pocillopora meandrina]